MELVAARTATTGAAADAAAGAAAEAAALRRRLVAMENRAAALEVLLFTAVDVGPTEFGNRAAASSGGGGSGGRGSGNGNGAYGSGGSGGDSAGRRRSSVVDDAAAAARDGRRGSGLAAVAAAAREWQRGSAAGERSAVRTEASPRWPSSSVEQRRGSATSTAGSLSPPSVFATGRGTSALPAAAAAKSAAVREVGMRRGSASPSPASSPSPADRRTERPAVLRRPRSPFDDNYDEYAAAAAPQPTREAEGAWEGEQSAQQQKGKQLANAGGSFHGSIAAIAAPSSVSPLQPQDSDALTCTAAAAANVVVWLPNERASQDGGSGGGSGSSGSGGQAAAAFVAVSTGAADATAASIVAASLQDRLWRTNGSAVADGGAVRLGMLQAGEAAPTPRRRRRPHR
ncbi:unnamed protein product [Phaeothamnion confervicola]